MSTLMFWNKQNNNATNNNQNADAKNGKRNWLHTPDALTNGHVVYLVKFLGNTPVEHAKGIDVVKDAIRRLQFSQQMKKAETGNQPKLKKVEITISVDGVAVQEPRTQKILHQFPLHNISYCADEKGVKKFFSFIAKNNPPQQNGVTNGQIGNGNGNVEESHECFVFVSSKLASDITLTIGQAFELAYRRYMNDSGKGTDSSKSGQAKQLERTVAVYKNRLKELSSLIPKSDLERILSQMGIHDLLEVPALENGVVENGTKTSESDKDEKLLIETSNKTFVPTVPPRNLQSQINSTLDAFKPSGQKMDELLLNSDSDSDFDPRAEEIESNSSSGNKIGNDLFGFEPSKSFGQQNFVSNNNNNNNSFSSNHNILTNGFVNGVSGPPISPPPLLAPPPKAAVPRRNPTAMTNGNVNGSQDLFGSTPFGPTTPSIFDDQIGSDSISALNHNNFNGTKNTSDAFDESGIHDMNDSIKLNSVLPEINTLAMNFNKLDGLLKSNDPLSKIGVTNGTESSNPFATSSPAFNEPITASKKDQFSISNPFAKKTESVKTGANYDALRNSPELNESVDQSDEKAKVKSKSFGIDLFKEAATAAFSELNYGNSTSSSANSLSNGGGGLLSSNGNLGSNGGMFSQTSSSSSSSSKHEFSNKMAGFAFSAPSQTNHSVFGSNQLMQNNMKSSLVDDFSLESLDPLRK